MEDLIKIYATKIRMIKDDYFYLYYINWYSPKGEESKIELDEIKLIEYERPCFTITLK